jgi:hypothetical protein
MTLRALGVAAILLVFTSSAVAGGVDWSDYIEKPGTSRALPMQKTAPMIDFDEEPAPAKATPTKATKAKPKRVARTSKAKTNKTKAKSRAKAKRRR